MNFPTPIAQNLQRSLDQWSKAEQHFQNAIQATLAHDDDAYTREMAEFNRIKSTWGDCAARTVAGAPAGLSHCGSQAKPLIDYRKEGSDQ